MPFRRGSRDYRSEGPQRPEVHDGRQCPLWVKSGHRGQLKECPLYPQKRTLKLSRVMSAMCQKQTSVRLDSRTLYACIGRRIPFSVQTRLLARLSRGMAAPFAGAQLSMGSFPTAISRRPLVRLPADKARAGTASRCRVAPHQVRSRIKRGRCPQYWRYRKETLWRSSTQ